MIVGIDEVGRGAWAGPLCVGAVALGGITIDGLTDSKLLTKKRRTAYSILIKQQAPLVGIGWVSAKDIDRIGIGQALKLAARRALREIDSEQVNQIIIDGTIALIDDPRVTLMKKADLLVPSVSAASVVAKVARDEYMAQCHKLFDVYKWNSNVGYGAKVHHEAIRQHGTTPLHRMSFAPMKLSHSLEEIKPTSNASTIGAAAEGGVCKYLIAQKFTIVERNWKTKWCEIDIVASKGGVTHFIEVKYRVSDRQGGGFAAITPKKMRQMRFAATLWLQNKSSQDAVLSAAEVTGTNYETIQFIENVR